MTLTRRQFLKRTAAAAAASTFPLVSSGRAIGANDRILVGIVGLGIRGLGAHLPGFQNQDKVSVVALCDADRQRMGSAADAIQKKYGHKVEQYVDMRRLFERKDIDVIANATQNYWHGLSTIWACQAGKHVYVEKPLSHYIWEGRQMVNAARRHNKIVQVGTQRRSQGSVAQAIAWIQKGELGKIRCIVAFANKRRSSCGKRDTPLPIPDHVDYELWCGPARKLPIFRDRLQYDCSFDWNTGGGESINQGVHEVDVARWCLGEDRLPRRVMSLGGRFVYNDACDAPNTQIICFDFPTAPVLYEVHNLRRARDAKDMPDYRGEAVGVVVHCDGGVVSLYRGLAWDNQGKQIRTFAGGGDHFVNFINALRSGRRADLHADVEVGHVSTAVCHAGNISYRLGRPASVAEQRAAVRDIPVWNEMYDRYLAHLKGHDINPDTTTLGPWLDIDREHECFRDSKEANVLVRGHYREPFVVPEVTA